MSEEKKSHEVLVPLPKEHENRPFVLVWAEKTSLDRLKKGDLAFSEAVKGLTSESFGEPESAETTGSNPEAADTTITF